MSFLETVGEDSAPADVAANYERDIERLGYLPNYSRIFSLHPDAYVAWRRLIGTISGPMEERRYELATLAAARGLHSTYCSLAHGKILAEKFLEPPLVEQIVTEGPAILGGLDAAVFDLAAKVVDDSTSIGPDDIERLRAFGLSDRDIFDVILSAAARCFFSKVLDATGTLADSVYEKLDPELKDSLTVGRPIERG